MGFAIRATRENSFAIYDAGEPAGPLALPGKYQVRLTVAGKIHTASLELRMDPRVQTSAEDLRKQFDRCSSCSIARTR